MDQDQTEKMNQDRAEMTDQDRAETADQDRAKKAEQKKAEKAENKEKRREYRRLVFQALPEIQSFQLLTKVFLFLLMTLFSGFATKLLYSTEDGIVTTANLRVLFTTWQGWACLLLGVLIVFIYIAMDLLAQIRFCDNILSGRPTKTFATLAKGFAALPKFITLAGLPAILFIFLAIPLVGIGFRISLMQSFYIPSFIMDVVFKTPLYAVLYGAAYLLLLWLLLRYQFTLHGVIISGLTVREAKKQSVRLFRANWKDLFKKMAFIYIVVSLTSSASITVLYLIPQILRLDEGINDTDARRFLIFFVLMLSVYLVFIIGLLGGGYLMFYFTKLYKTYAEGEPSYLPRPRKKTYIAKIFFNLAVVLFTALIAIGLTLMLPDEVLEPRDVGLVAHRAGGTLASENSLDGLEAAIEHDMFGSETDIQRTSDGYYIINHDNTFKRLAGEPRAPQEMTLKEVKALSFPDTTGNGKTQHVATLEEMLDVIKGREILFIELKGKTADRQMVDDTVRIVREKDCLEDVVLISLNYDVINYAETTYPEFETGILIFGTYGAFGSLNADYILLEEESATCKNLLLIHGYGKKAGVWTLNDSAGLSKFLDRTINVIITDNLAEAETLKNKVQKKDVNLCLIERFQALRGVREIICDFLDRIYLYAREHPDPEYIVNS